MSQALAYDNIMAVLDQVVADHSAYPLVVEVENRNAVDQASQADPYLKVEIKFMGGGQLDLADHPHVEQWGQLWLSAVCKDGDGTLASIRLLDFIAPYFQFKNLGLVQCRAVLRASGKSNGGLYRLPALVNFYYHEST